MSVLFLNGSPNKHGNTAALAGRKLVFLFQGAAPEGWMLEKAEYTMSRFARMYGMEYVGMASNGSQAKALSEKI